MNINRQKIRKTFMHKFSKTCSTTNNCFLFANANFFTIFFFFFVCLVFKFVNVQNVFYMILRSKIKSKRFFMIGIFFTFLNLMEKSSFFNTLALIVSKIITFLLKLYHKYTKIIKIFVHKFSKTRQIFFSLCKYNSFVTLNLFLCI